VVQLRLRIGLFRFADCSDHIERALGIILELIPENAFAAVERVFEADQFSFDPAELLSREKWLSEEAFQPPRTGDALRSSGESCSNPSIATISLRPRTAPGSSVSLCQLVMRSPTIPGVAMFEFDWSRSMAG